MGIESIESIGKAASVTPAIASVGRGVSFRPIGSSFGPSLEGSIGGFTPNIVNEGSVAPSFLENTMTLSFNKPVGEIIFNPFKGKEAPSIIGQAEEVAAAAWKVSEPVSVNQQAEQVAVKAWELHLASPGLAWEAKATRMPEVSWTQPAVLDRKISDWTGNLVRIPEPAIVRLPSSITNPFRLPKVESGLQSLVQTRAENNTTNAVGRATSITTQKEVQIEQVVEERKMVTEDRKEEKTKAKKSEKTTQLKVKLVEAVHISEKRRLEIKQAAKKARSEAEKSKLSGITGRLVRKLLAISFWEHKSPIALEGKDGTLPLTAQALEADTTEYKDEKEAEDALVQVVAKHIPVQQGEGGRLATLEEVREVFEGKEKEVFKLNTPAEMVIKKVVRKNETVVSTGQAVKEVVEEKEEVVGEPTLKTLGLEELFQKAA